MKQALDGSFFISNVIQPSGTPHFLEHSLSIHRLSEIGRHLDKIWYWKDTHKTDSIFLGQYGVKLIKVCADLSWADTKMREFASLIAAMARFNTTHARIIILDKDAVLETDMGQVTATSFWSWFWMKT